MLKIIPSLKAYYICKKTIKMKTILYKSKNLIFFTAETETSIELTLIPEIKAGFPSPAEDFQDQSIDLNKILVRNPSSTFYARVKGKSMQDAGLSDGDLLVIDKSLEPVDGKIAVCFIDGEFTVKRIKIGIDCCFLVPANSDFNPIKVTAENDFLIWGIVVHVIKSL